MFRLEKKETTDLSDGSKTYTVTLFRVKKHKLPHPRTSVKEVEGLVRVHSYSSKVSMEDAEKAFNNVMKSLSEDLTKQIKPKENTITLTENYTLVEPDGDSNT